MAFSSAVVTSATKKLEEQRQLLSRQGEINRANAYQKDPRLGEIDKLLQQSMAKLFGITLKKDTSSTLEEVKEINLRLQEERNQRILALGYHPDALGDQYHCTHCHDSGWVGVSMCQCLKDFCVQEQLAQISLLIQGQHKTFAQFTLDYYSKNQWMDTPTSPYENMAMIYNTCKAYSDQFPHPTLKNLLLSGSPGLGKTFLSGCIASDLTQRGLSVRYETVGRLMQVFEMRQFSKQGSDAFLEAQAEIQQYLSCDLMLLDDLGTENAAYVTEPALYELVNTRLTQNKNTVISTNLSAEELSKRYSPQLYSRLNGEYWMLNFYGEDIRPMIKGNP